MNSARPTLIVCEQSGHWASAIRRLFSPRTTRLPGAATEGLASVERPDRQVRGVGTVFANCRVVEARTAENCLGELARASSALVALEIAGGASDWSLELLSTISDRHPTAKVVVLAERNMRRYEWLARELGAIHFIASPRLLAPLARIAERHWKITQAQEVAAPESARLVETIWQSLPWG